MEIKWVEMTRVLQQFMRVELLESEMTVRNSLMALLKENCTMFQNWSHTVWMMRFRERRLIKDLSYIMM